MRCSGGTDACKALQQGRNNRASKHSTIERACQRERGAVRSREVHMADGVVSHMRKMAPEASKPSVCIDDAAHNTHSLEVAQ